MKTNEVSSEKSKNFFYLSEDWNLKRALRVSLKVALIYSVLSGIGILIFGAKPEIVINLKLTEELTKVITLPWNSWFNILPNFFGIIIFGMSIFLFVKLIDKKIFKEDLVIFLFTCFVACLILGLVVSFFCLAASLAFGLAVSLGVGLVVSLAVSLVVGLIWLIKKLCSAKLWIYIWKWFIK